MDQLRFLIRAHGLQRMVLIAHQNCVFYGDALHVPPAQIETRQRDDLHAAAERIRSIAHDLAIGTFFCAEAARRQGPFRAVGRPEGRLGVFQNELTGLGGTSLSLRRA